MSQLLLWFANKNMSETLANPQSPTLNDNNEWLQLDREKFAYKRNESKSA